MAIIGIVCVIIVLLTPTVSGYINRSKKLNIIIQARNIVEYCVSLGINPDDTIKLKELKENNWFKEYSGKIDALQDDINYATLRAISKEDDAIKKIEVDNWEIIEWTGENPYKKK
ncbi:hypothetical protein [Clostridium saudiense]|uniref:hypothetical protein n=1 Tax=Clostridium saudiense TaxID=1414720 RepID=UPI0018AB6044|nr:hypothetical protein [Clostridium saudiense]